MIRVGEEEEKQKNGMRESEERGKRRVDFFRSEVIIMKFGWIEIEIGCSTFFKSKLGKLNRKIND
jgi:hypothetical protein